MRRALIHAIPLTLAMASVACSGLSSRASNPAALLSVRLASSTSREFAEFNRTIAQAIAAGETWPSDPVMITYRFAPWTSVRTAIWIAQGSSEHPSRYEVTVLTDGLADDSIRGRRLDLSLERASDQSWRITQAKASWRCWPGRGHDSFASQPCQ